MGPKRAKASKAEVDRLQAVVEEMARKEATFKDLEKRLQDHEIQCQEDRTRFSTSLNLLTLHLGQRDERYERERLAWGERESELVTQLEQLEEEVGEKEALEARVKELEDRSRKAELQLQRAEGQLEFVRGFLNTADQYSGAEIANAVEQLNSNIYQCASMLADKVPDNSSPGFSQPDVSREAQQGLREEAFQALRGSWGPQVVDSLVSEVSGGHTSLLRSMIQHIICSWCYHIFGAIFPENPDAEDGIKAVLDGIHSNYDFRIAKNWLAMLHAQLDPSEPSGIDRSEMILGIHLVITVAGWRGESSVLEQAMAGRVDCILEEVLTIKTMIFEGTLTTEFEAVFPPRHSPYDSNTMTVVGGASTKEWDHEFDEGVAEIAFPIGFGVKFWCPKLSQSTVVTMAKVVML